MDLGRGLCPRLGHPRDEALGRYALAGKVGADARVVESPIKYMSLFECQVDGSV